MKRSSLIILFMLTGLLGLAAWYPADSSALRAFPVVLPPPSTAPAMNELVIFYSGDGGWAPLEQAISHNLNQRGYGVLGISTLAYFWHEQPVADSAAQLDALITAYRKQWSTPRVWLIGFSFGANVLPSLINQLKPENRARISQLTLLEPTQDVFLEIELEHYISVGWLNRITQAYRHLREPVTHHDPLPALLQLKGRVPVTCLHTDENSTGLCRQPSLREWVSAVEIPGTHYFNGDFANVTQRLIERHPSAPAGP
ncbi:MULTISPECIES: AcvB/VirJ family lysyl-phosphatidylglycerol hydrolase [Pseudomonas]|mgnify:CR=1 FL=1|uniref:AcvB/VirJ family lysyl-phosphatidylglycerol hydrolase n=1 Tax=Pseudomonas TaxID=286 RepID=UPI00084B7B91|nr:AcvB/VirJ family lysyl-phosphatidylglycerol hydrolase [Pseudomonas sp. AP19]OEC73880.1 hypothetical protein A7D21_15980 [Pseudomonas sp. AP19]